MRKHQWKAVYRLCRAIKNNRIGSVCNMPIVGARVSVKRDLDFLALRIDLPAIYFDGLRNHTVYHTQSSVLWSARDSATYITCAIVGKMALCNLFTL